METFFLTSTIVILFSNPTFQPMELGNYALCPVYGEYSQLIPSFLVICVLNILANITANAYYKVYQHFRSIQEETKQVLENSNPELIQSTNEGYNSQSTLKLTKNLKSVSTSVMKSSSTSNLKMHRIVFWKCITILSCLMITCTPIFITTLVRLITQVHVPIWFEFIIVITSSADYLLSPLMLFRLNDPIRTVFYENIWPKHIPQTKISWFIGPAPQENSNIA